MKKIMLFLTNIVIVLALLIAAGCGRTNSNYSYEWTKDGRYICHALGRIDEYAYTNSKEAFQENYKKGYRIFEIDIEFTSDDRLVLIHSWKNKDLKKLFGIERDESENLKPLSYEEFINSEIYGKYTALSFEDFTKIIKDYPDVYIVLDGKYDSESKDKLVEEYQMIHDMVNENCPDMLDRFIPQIYDEEMLTTIDEIYQWKSMIYTLYHFKNDAEFDPDKEMSFAMKNDIKVITMDEDREFDFVANGFFKKNIIDKGLMVYVHTINDPEQAEKLMEDGVYGFYSDDLI
ncbi:MAG: hypothetical protein K5894_14700 [Lachnospiraceae bacterium]|nr:hypothetical protein [Lachnospiraceae bacterium]